MMKTNSCCATVLALGLAFPGVVCADNIDYAATGSQFGTIDLQTGVFTPIGELDGILGSAIQDLARLPGGLLYADNADSKLALLDPVTLTTSLVGVCGNNLFGLAFRQDGTLFGCSGDTLYRIDPNTGATTLVGAMGISSGYFDMKFDGAGNLYFVGTPNLSQIPTLYRLNTTNGQAVQIGQGGAIGFEVWALDFANGTLFGFTSDGKIVSINTTTGVGTFVANESQPSPVVTAAPGGVGVGEPSLTIQLTNINSAIVSWLAPSNAFRLEQNSNVTTTNWVGVTNAVSVTNSQNQVVVSPAAGNRFYRLASP